MPTTPYHLVLKDSKGKVLARKPGKTTEKATRNAAINLAASGKYFQVEVVFRAAAKDKPAVLITYFPKNNMVWWSQDGKAGPVSDEGESLSQDVLDDAPQYTEEFLTAPVKKPPPPEKPFNYGGLIAAALGIGSIYFIARRATKRNDP